MGKSDFRFESVVVYRKELTNGFIVEALGRDAPVRLRIYGKRIVPDPLSLIEVAGEKQRQDGVYVVKEFDVLDRFAALRVSFKRLTVALFIVETAIKAHMGYEPVLEFLKKLETETDEGKVVLLFCLFFLKDNGIFDPASFPERQKDMIGLLFNDANLSKTEKRDLFSAFVERMESYLDSGIKNASLVEEVFK